MKATATFLLAALLLVPPQAGLAQLAGPHTAAGCIGVAGAGAPVTATGRLRLRTFAGPPNYESVAGGDAAERTFILELPRPACIDGGEFADPSERVVTVHLSSNDAAIRARLRRAVGRRVTASGEGFAAHTGHHHAPLVLLADRLTVH
jgi:hypothetical protein